MEILRSRVTFSRFTAGIALAGVLLGGCEAGTHKPKPAPTESEPMDQRPFVLPIPTCTTTEKVNGRTATFRTTVQNGYQPAMYEPDRNIIAFGDGLGSTTHADTDTPVTHTYKSAGSYAIHSIVTFDVAAGIVLPAHAKDNTITCDTHQVTITEN